MAQRDNQPMSSKDDYNTPTGHFAPVPVQAYSDRRLSPADLKVLAMLCYRHNGKTGQCNPSNEDLANLCAMSTRQVQRSTSRLSDFSYIEKVIQDGKGRYTTNRYRLKLPQNRGDKAVTPAPLRGDKAVAQGRQGCHPEQNIEHNYKRDPPTPRSRFEDFWRTYPKKVGKQICKTIWKTKNLDSKADELIADIENRLANDRQWEAPYRYVRHPQRYLNEAGWDDEVQPKGTKHHETPNRNRQPTMRERHLESARQVEQELRDLYGDAFLHPNGQPVRPQVDGTLPDPSAEADGDGGLGTVISFPEPRRNKGRD